MHRERRRIYYSGRVQGVGFRYTCHSLARDFDVSGYVRNLPCGRVELVVEGQPEELDRLSATILHQMGNWIQGVSTEPDSTIGDLPLGFTIRY